MKVGANICESFFDADRISIQQIQFQVTDPHGSFAKLEHELNGLTNKFESGGVVDIHGFTFSHYAELVQWFKGRNGKIAILANAVAMLQSIGATHTLNQDYLCDQEATKKILLGSEIGASIRDSFSTVLLSILVGNKKERTDGAYEFLVGYIKDYYIWHPCGAQGYSGPRKIIREGTATVTGRLKRLRNTLNTDTELKELSIYLAKDYADFIS